MSLVLNGVFALLVVCVFFAGFFVCSALRLGQNTPKPDQEDSDEEQAQ